MAIVTRKIGLSLGADICWPATYEELIRRLDLSIPLGNDEVRFDVERVQVEPFDLQYHPRYDLVLDRITHWFMTTREWIKKITLMDGVYVLNNPWSIQANEKHTTYCAMMKLGMPVPKTWMIPPKEYADEKDTQYTIRRYNKLFDLKDVGNAVGFPNFIKPYDGGAWVGVKRCKDAKELQAAYDASGTRVHHLQASVENWDLFIRAIGVGPQVNIVRYDPDAPLHARYMVDFHFLKGEEWVKAARICRTINAFFGWDHNSCEMLRKDGELYPIDFANACPDSQVQSLHYHFPWLVKALIRWTLFCAYSRRPMRLNLDWQRFFDKNDPEMTFEEKLPLYDALAKEHFDVERFEEFSERYLGDLDEIALEFFGSDRFREITREKVANIYPKHEIDEFTQHFYGLIQFWRRTERDRLDADQIEGADATEEAPIPVDPQPTGQA